MKKLILLFSFWPLFAFGQIFIDFDSGLTGEWEQFPPDRWKCSGAESLSGTQSLQHAYDNPLAGTDIISLKTGIIDPDEIINWDFLLRHGYPPSSSNKWAVILLSDSPASGMGDQDIYNAYCIGVNLSESDDSLRFYVINQGIISGSVSMGLDYESEAGTSGYHFIITRDTSGIWIIKGGMQGSQTREIKRFKLAHTLLFRPQYFGIKYTYSSLRDRLLWFDELHINARIIADTIPPVIIQSKVLSSRSIKIQFSEELDVRSITRENIILTPPNTFPDSLILKKDEMIILFKDPLVSGKEYSLLIKEVGDLQGNSSGQLRQDFIWYLPVLYDIIITEIMADPQPSVYLPDVEYIEICNRSKYPVDLDSFLLSTGSRKWILPVFQLDAGDYVVFTGPGYKDIHPGVKMLNLFTSSSVISNEGQELSIADRNGNIISAVYFKKSWYDDDFKSEGGWSLERIDNHNICGEEENWKASVDPSGGTPGEENSVKAKNPDLEKPYLGRPVFHDNQQIELSFSESMNPLNMVDRSGFVIEKGNLLPDTILPVSPLYKSVLLSYSQSFKEGEIYTMKLSEKIADCSGNELDIKEQIRLGIPVKSNYLDVLISEILFSPQAGCAEFIELYNNSGRLLELSDLRIQVTGNGSTADKTITAEPVLFFPGEYIVITKDKESLMFFFDCIKPESIIECPDMPLLSNDGACMKVLNRSLQTVDEYCYSPFDQFALISGQNGVSLERLRLNRQTGNESVWHSASSVSGFGTPGYENSQALDDRLIKPDFNIMPEVFSPDNDGYEDIMIFSYLFEKEGYSGNVCVFDPAGRIIKYIARNEIFGTSGWLSWDGRDERGRLCRSGIYLIYLEAFHPGGKMKKFKGTVVVSVRNI